jgi:hypothetical protein
MIILLLGVSAMMWVMLYSEFLPKTQEPRVNVIGIDGKRARPYDTVEPLAKDLGLNPSVQRAPSKSVY